MGVDSERKRGRWLGVNGWSGNESITKTVPQNYGFMRTSLASTATTIFRPVAMFCDLFPSIFKED